MNLFWLGVGGISLLIAHLVIFLFLRWRTQKSVHGILSVPRFELFLLILMLPCISQSAAFVIRGKHRSSSLRQFDFVIENINTQGWDDVQVAQQGEYCVGLYC